MLSGQHGKQMNMYNMFFLFYQCFIHCSCSKATSLKPGARLRITRLKVTHALLEMTTGFKAPDANCSWKRLRERPKPNLAFYLSRLTTTTTNNKQQTTNKHHEQQHQHQQTCLNSALNNPFDPISCHSRHQKSGPSHGTTASAPYR